jgi:hypothetical protein
VDLKILCPNKDDFLIFILYELASYFLDDNIISSLDEVDENVNVFSELFS